MGWGEGSGGGSGSRSGLGLHYHDDECEFGRYLVSITVGGRMSKDEMHECARWVKMQNIEGICDCRIRGLGGMLGERTARQNAIRHSVHLDLVASWRRETQDEVLGHLSAEDKKKVIDARSRFLED